jgi:CBS domain-containing protein
MGQMVRDVMTTNVITLAATATIFDAAKKMKENDIGDIMVMQGGRLAGILTDRDIVVRAIAAGADPTRIVVDDICSHDLTTVAPDDDVDKAVQLMRDKSIRRLPVTDKGRPVGIVSLGDLAQSLDRSSCLGEISATPPNR